MSDGAEADSASTAQALSSRERQLAGLKPWRKGSSGNPAGRPPAPVDIAALARQHGPRCVAVAAELLDDPDPRIRLAALVALLDRGFGRPVQAVAGQNDMPTILQLMHHEAAFAFSNELQAERKAAERQLREPLVINGEATNTPNTNGSTRVNLFEPALE
jgi:hypothetical protein